MYRDRRVSLLILTATLLLVELGTITPAHATPMVAIVLYDHGLAKDVKWLHGHLVPINQTNSFTQDDAYAYAYFTAALSAANVTWQWFDPSGALYRTRDDQLQCAISPCSFVFYFRINDSPAADKFGLWTLSLQAGGYTLFTETFTISPVINQEDHWNFMIEQSAPPHTKGQLTVTIHPSNLTWSRYQMYMPYAANITAYQKVTKQPLNVTTSSATGDNYVTVNFGGPRTDGY